MIKLGNVRVGNWELKELPKRYALLYIIWYSKSSTITLHRLSVMVYLSSHAVKYGFDIPPILSNELINDVEVLIKESLIEYLGGKYSLIKVTDKGRGAVGELYRLSNEYVLVGDYLVVKVRDLLNELGKIVSAYQDMPMETLLSIALREESLKLSGMARDLISSLSFELRSPCENITG